MAAYRIKRASCDRSSCFYLNQTDTLYSQNFPKNHAPEESTDSFEVFTDHTLDDKTRNIPYESEPEAVSSIQSGYASFETIGIAWSKALSPKYPRTGISSPGP